MQNVWYVLNSATISVLLTSQIGKLMKIEMEMEIIADSVSWGKEEYELGYFEIEFKLDR